MSVWQMPTQTRRSGKAVLALVALVAIVVVAAVALSGNFMSGQKTYPTVAVSGRIDGQVFTEGNAVGSVTAMYFGKVGGQSPGGELPADIKPDGTYSIRLTNGMNYTVLLNVVDPSNSADTGVCQGQPVSLNNLHEGTYVVDIIPFNCG